MGQPVGRTTGLDQNTAVFPGFRQVLNNYDQDDDDDEDKVDVVSCTSPGVSPRTSPDPWLRHDNNNGEKLGPDTDNKTTTTAFKTRNQVDDTDIDDNKFAADDKSTPGSRLHPGPVPDPSKTF